MPAFPSWGRKRAGGTNHRRSARAPKKRAAACISAGLVHTLSRDQFNRRRLGRLSCTEGDEGKEATEATTRKNKQGEVYG